MSDPREDADNLINRTREAHEVLKDLKATIRRAEEVIKLADDTKLRLVAEVIAAVDDDLIGSAITAGLENYERSIIAAIETAEDAIFSRFDGIARVLMEGDGTGPTLQELVKLKKQIDAAPMVNVKDDPLGVHRMHETIAKRGVPEVKP
jgi:hypothetical protein